MTEITNIPEAGGIADIVVGIDDSPSSHAALDWAAKAARSSGDRLRAVHVLTAALTSPLVWTNGFPAMAYVAETQAPEIAEKTMTAMFDAVVPEPGWTLEFCEGSTAQQNAINGFTLGTGSNIQGCTAAFNGTDGILTLIGTHITGCSANGNSNDGIQVGSDCYVVGNISTSNGAGVPDGACIHATGSDNRIDGNNVTDCDRGIDVDSLGNVIVRNSASGNGTQYDIVGGNDVGPIGTAAASTSPWANLSF